MFEAIGHSVLKLKRVQFGPIQLGDLPFGQFRYLTPVEITKLKKLMADGKQRIPESSKQKA
jgi:23S rRNA pseudouridine2605 synthase